MAWMGNCTTGPPRRGYWSASKDDCQNFPTPCPDIDKGWFDCTDGPDVTQGGCAKNQNADHWGNALHSPRTRRARARADHGSHASLVVVQACALAIGPSAWSPTAL